MDIAIGLFRAATTVPQQGEIDPLAQRLRAAALGAPLTYIVSGDSTRDEADARLLRHGYRDLFGRIGAEIVDNADSGDTAAGWADNTGSPNLADAIAATPGTGATTILEFSFGLNDYNARGDEVAAKAAILSGLAAYRAARPDAAVVLVTPVHTANTNRNEDLTRIYREMAQETGLPLVDIVADMASVWDGAGPNVFYRDGTHPTLNGARRLLHLIADAIVPADLAPTFALDNAYMARAGDRAGYVPAIETGKYWVTSSGEDASNAAWGRLAAMPCYGGELLRVTHDGNRADAIFMDADGTFIERRLLAAVSGESYREVTAPGDAVEVRFNVTSELATYQAGTPVAPALTYVGATVPARSLSEIDAGLSLRLPRKDYGASIEPGFWVTTTSGNPATDAGWRRLQPIAVAQFERLRIHHGGNRHDLCFMDQAGANISGQITATAVSGETFRIVDVPAGAVEVRINVSSDAAGWDGLGLTPSVKAQ